MNGPDPKLMRRFGTQDVYEQKLAGSSPFAARMTMGFLNVKRTQSDDHDAEVARAKAEMMNRAFADLQARLMQPVTDGLRHTHAPGLLSQGYSPGMMNGQDVPVGMDEGMVRLAHAMGRDLAHVDLEAMEKDAGIGSVMSGIGSAVGKAVSTAGNAFSAGAKAVPKAMGTLGKTFNTMRSGGSGVAGGNGLVPSLTGALGKATNTFQSSLKGNFRKMQTNSANAVSNAAAQTTRDAALKTVSPDLRARFEAKQQSLGLNPNQAPQKPVQPVGQLRSPAPVQNTARQQGLAQAASMTPEQKQQARIDRRLNPPAPSPAVAPATKRQPVGGQGQPPATTPQVQNGAAPPEQPPMDLGGQIQKGWERTGLANGQWKTKLPALAAGAAGVYGAVQGAKALANTFSEESPAPQYNQGGAQPASGINQYGYTG